MMQLVILVVLLLIATDDEARATAANAPPPSVVVVNCSVGDPTTVDVLSFNIYVLENCTKAVLLYYNNDGKGNRTSTFQNTSFVMRGGVAFPRVQIEADVVRHVRVDFQSAVLPLVQYQSVDVTAIYLTGAMSMENISIDLKDITILTMHARSLATVASGGTARDVVISLCDCTIVKASLYSSFLSVLGVGSGSFDILNITVANSNFTLMFIEASTTITMGFYRMDSLRSVSSMALLFSNLTLAITMQGPIKGTLLFRIFGAEDISGMTLLFQHVRATYRALAVDAGGAVVEAVTLTIGKKMNRVAVTLSDCIFDVVSGRIAGLGVKGYDFISMSTFDMRNTYWALNATLPSLLIQQGSGATAMYMNEPHGASVVDISMVNRMDKSVSVTVVQCQTNIFVRSPVGFPQNYSAAYARFVYLQSVNASYLAIVLSELTLTGDIVESSDALKMLYGFMIVAVGVFQVNNATFDHLNMSINQNKMVAAVDVTTPLINSNIYVFSRRIVMVTTALVQFTSNCSFCELSIVHSHLELRRLQMFLAPSGLPYAAGFINVNDCAAVVLLNTTALVDCTGISSYMERCGEQVASVFRQQLVRVYRSDNCVITIIDSIIQAEDARVTIDGSSTSLTVALIGCPASLVNTSVDARHVEVRWAQSSVVGAAMLLSNTVLVGLHASLSHVSGFPSLISSKIASGNLVVHSHLSAHRTQISTGWPSSLQRSRFLSIPATIADGMVALTATSITLSSCSVALDNSRSSGLEYFEDSFSRLLFNRYASSSWSAQSKLVLEGCSRWGEHRLTRRLTEKLLSASTPAGDVGSNTLLLLLDDDACEGTSTIEQVPVLRVARSDTAAMATLAAMIGSVFVSSSSTAVRLETSMAVLRATRLCTGGAEEDEEEDRPGSAFADNPLQLSLNGISGGSEPRLAAGTVIGNSIIVVVWPILVEWLIPSFKNVWSLNGFRSTCKRFVASLPGDGVGPLLLLLQPTFAASVTLLRDPKQVGMSLGVLGILFYTGGVVLIIGCALYDFSLAATPLPHPRRGLLFAKFRAISSSGGSRNSSSCVGATSTAALEKWYVRIFWHRSRWVARIGEGAKNRGLAQEKRFASTLQVYRSGCHWFFALDVALPMCMGILVGIATITSTSSSCLWVPWVAAVLVSVMTLLSIGLRPYSTPWHNVNQIVVGNMMTCITLLLVATGQSSTTLETVVTVQSLICVAAVAIDLVTVVVKAACTVISENDFPDAGMLSRNVQSIKPRTPHQVSSRRLSSHPSPTKKASCGVGKAESSFLFPQAFCLALQKDDTPATALSQLIAAACEAGKAGEGRRRRSDPLFLST